MKYDFILDENEGVPSIEVFDEGGRVTSLIISGLLPYDQELEIMEELSTAWKLAKVMCRTVEDD